MPDARQGLGRWGELVAARWLEHKGWRVLTRRFRVGHRDIDLVAELDGTVAFVEVKARGTAEFGGPMQSVNWKKQRELARAASVWVDRHGRPGLAYRFDVIGIVRAGGRIRVSHVENAFFVRIRA